MDCPNITGALAPVAPVLNTPLHRGWSTTQKYVPNPLVPKGTFLAAGELFFSHLLMSKYNLIFTITYGSGLF